MFLLNKTKKKRLFLGPRSFIGFKDDSFTFLRSSFEPPIYNPRSATVMSVRKREYDSDHESEGEH